MRKKKPKPKAYPVISPSKGIFQVQTYARALPRGRPKPIYRPPSVGSEEITQLHQRIPSDLTREDWEVLHHQLGPRSSPPPLIIPESPTIRPHFPDSAKVPREKRQKVSIECTVGNHVYDSEDEPVPCRHCP